MVKDRIIEPSQYLTFILDKEVYGLEIQQVREVLDFTTITKVPGMPDFTRGIINLRESVVPVVDLKLKFNIEKTQKTVDTCIIIIEFLMGGETSIIGILADSVKEVLTLEPNQLEPAPKMGTRLNSGFIKGIGKKDSQFIIILDIEKIFSSEEIEGVLHTRGVPLPEKNEEPDEELMDPKEEQDSE